MLEFKSVKIKKPDDVNVILGQSHFIKTVEDLYETLTNSVPGIIFLLAKPVFFVIIFLPLT